jgi:hypothetical protein
VIDVEESQVSAAGGRLVNDGLRVVRAAVKDEQYFGVFEGIEVLDDGFSDPRALIVSGDDQREPRCFRADLARGSQKTNSKFGLPKAP